MYLCARVRVLDRVAFPFDDVEWIQEIQTQVSWEGVVTSGEDVVVSVLTT